MTYASKQDLIDRFTEQELIELTDMTNVPPEVIDDTKVTRALTDTDSLINSYISTRYSVPVSPVPSILNEKACAITRYKLYRNGCPDRVTSDNKDAIAWLNMVANGSVSLADVATAPIAQTSGSSVKTNNSRRTFTRDTLRDF